MSPNGNVNFNDNSVYNVDKLLLEYASTSNFNNRINISKLFNTFKTVILQFQNQRKVLDRIKDIYSDNLTQLNLSENFIPNNANLNEFFIYLEYTNSTYNFNDLINILGSIQDFNTNSTITHQQADRFMTDIIKSLCQLQFTSIFQNLIINPNATISNDDKLTMNNVLNIVKMATSVNKNILDIVDTISDSVTKIINNELNNSKDLNTGMMTDFSNNSNSFKSPFYYSLRTKLINDIHIKTKTIPIDESSDVMVYIKKIICDAYIKTYFPYLHYVFIDNLLNKYKTAGDYVNTRVALLSKIFLTVNLLSSFKNTYSGNDTTLIDNYNKKLTDYMTKLNNNDINASPGTDVITNILKEIHKKSGDVVQAKDTINTLRTSTTTNQQALRNIVTNNELMQKRIYTYTFVFYIMILILLILIATTTTLITIGKTDYAYYIIIMTLFLIFMVKLIQIVRSFVVKVI